MLLQMYSLAGKVNTLIRSWLVQ